MELSSSDPDSKSRPTARLMVENLCLSYGSRPVLNAVSFSVGTSEVVALVGKSGVGKSTLLRCLAGLLPPSSGNFTSLGRVAILFQDALLQPWLTAKQTIELPGKIGGFLVDAWALLEEVELGDRQSSYPRELSGGMKRRIALARALAQQPDILLLDEPFTGLDEVTAAKMYGLLARIVYKRRLAVVIVTHSVHEAVSIADRVLLLGGSPARITGATGIDKKDPQRQLDAESRIRRALLDDQGDVPC